MSYMDDTECFVEDIMTVFNDDNFFLRSPGFLTPIPENSCKSDDNSIQEDDMIIDEDEDDVNDEEPKCIQITIDDSDENDDIYDFQPSFNSILNKRKFSAISYLNSLTPNKQTKPCYEDNTLFLSIFVPDDIVHLILTYAMSRRFNTGISLKKKEYFPSWMGKFHVLKLFRNLSKTWREYIRKNYSSMILDTINSFRGDTLLRNLNLRNDTKTKLLKRVRDFILIDFIKTKNQDILISPIIENTDEYKNLDYERSWIFFKALVYLSSDFPRFSFRKDRNQSGIPGFRVLLKDDFIFGEVFNPIHFDILKKNETGKNIYRAAINTEMYEISKHEEKAFFTAGKVKFLLCEKIHHNQDKYILDLWKEYKLTRRAMKKIVY